MELKSLIKLEIYKDTILAFTFFLIAGCLLIIETFIESAMAALDVTLVIDHSKIPYAAIIFGFTTAWYLTMALGCIIPIQQITGIINRHKETGTWTYD